MSIRQFSKSLAFRIILTLVAAFLGTTGGIYFTQSWQEPKSKTKISDRSIEYPGPYLAFGAGDQFPAEKYKDREGNTGEFTDLLRGKKTVVLFVSLDCEPCASLVRAWRNDMSHRGDASPATCGRTDHNVVAARGSCFALTITRPPRLLK